MVASSREEAFNYALADALKQTSINWNDRTVLAQPMGILSGNRSPDIIIIDPTMPPVAIESEYGNRPDQDAISRIGLRELQTNQKIFTSIAVSIPDSFHRLSVNRAKDVLIDREQFGYAIWQSDTGEFNYEEFERGVGRSAHSLIRFPQQSSNAPPSFIQGDVFDLANVIPVAALPPRKVDEIATQVTQKIDAGARLMEEFLSESDRLTIAKTAYQRTSMKGLRTAMVLWLNAILIQHKLTNSMPNLAKVNFSDPYSQTISDQVQAWKQILDKNWHAIFAPAVQMLQAAGNSAPIPTKQALTYLIQSAELIQQSRLGEHISVGGELFPKVSEDRKNAAAYYTLPATAELLANLTIRREDRKDWDDRNLFKYLQLADLACGTGTLLRAGYKRIRNFHEQSRGSRQTLSDLHTDAMEHGLVGLDISPVAAHFTSSSLAALSEGEPYSNTRIGWVDVTGGKTGSLEFLGASSVKDLFDAYVGQSRGTRAIINEDTESLISVPDKTLDYILMNPPYSRTTGKHAAFDVAGLTNSERNSSQENWGKLIEGRPADKRAGMAASFLVLALDKIKFGGRIGFVLPMSLAFQATWKKTRKMIEQNFEDITVICTSSTLDSSFSADTGMQEILLIAKRRRINRQSNSIVCVTLTKNVTRSGEATIMAKSIFQAISQNRKHGNIRVGIQEIGRYSKFIAKNGLPWSDVGALHNELTVTTNRLIGEGVLFDFMDNRLWELPCSMTKVEDLFEVGHSSDSIGHVAGSTNKRGAFRFYQIVDKADSIGEDRSMWSTESNQTQLLVTPTHKGVVVDINNAGSIRAKTSKCFYKQEVRWNSQYLVGSMTQFAVLGGRSWCALMHQDERILRMLVIWLNSIFGMLCHWSVGGRTQVGRSNLSTTGIKEVPVPNFSELSSEKLDYAYKVFDKLSTRRLSRLYHAHTDSNRKEIDKAVATIFGWMGGRRISRSIAVCVV